MATIKVFDSKGVKEIHCFETLSNVPYMENVEDEFDPNEVAEDTDDGF